MEKLEPLIDTSENVHFTIIGAGPVGLVTALLLSKKGVKSEIYDRIPEIVNTFEESYPIGINPRALHTMSLVSGDLKKQAISEGILVDAWEIYAGTSRVARQDSKICYGTSRANVNLLLYNYAKKDSNIKIFLNHKLVSINDKDKEVLIDNNGKMVKVSVFKIIGADGVNSVVRAHLEKTFKLKTEVIRWTNTHKGLFGVPGEKNKDLDPGIHYIINSTYIAAVMNEGRLTWSFSMTANINDDEEENRTILATSPTPENIKKLKSLIKKRAPMILKSLTEEEIVKYFSRRSFNSSIVKCERYNQDEWILLLGDAAHSVLPPTGEGLNSGMEDVSVLYELFQKSGHEKLFKTYSDIRVKDLHPLFEYAKYLNSPSQFPGEAAARLIFQIFQGCFKRKIFNETFGEEGTKRMSYSSIIGSWERKKFWILNLSRCITYPIGIIFFILSPWRWGLCCKST